MLTVIFNRYIEMSHKIIETASSFGVSLLPSDGKQINDFLGITDKRKNLNDEQKLLVQQIGELVGQGKSVTEAISKAGARSAIAFISSTDKKSASSSVNLNANSKTTDEVDLNLIIESQANRVADAALMSLPDLAMSEMESIRAAFIRQFRKRIRERLQSVDYQSAFVTTIDSQVQLSAAETNNNAYLTNGLSNSEG